MNVCSQVVYNRPSAQNLDASGFALCLQPLPILLPVLKNSFAFCAYHCKSENIMYLQLFSGHSLTLANCIAVEHLSFGSNRTPTTQQNTHHANFLLHVSLAKCCQTTGGKEQPVMASVKCNRLWQKETHKPLWE